VATGGSTLAFTRNSVPHPVTTWNPRQLEPKLFAKCHKANHYNRCHGGDEEKVHRNSFLCVWRWWNSRSLEISQGRHISTMCITLQSIDQPKHTIPRRKGTVFPKGSLHCGKLFPSTCKDLPLQRPDVPSILLLRAVTLLLMAPISTEPPGASGSHPTSPHSSAVQCPGHTAQLSKRARRFLVTTGLLLRPRTPAAPYMSPAHAQ